MEENSPQDLYFPNKSLFRLVCILLFGSYITRFYRFLKPGGVSIPSEYTNYLAPITASKVHSILRDYRDLRNLETPYVVKLHAATEMFKYEPVFTFSHPNYSKNINNARYHRVVFSRDKDAPACQVKYSHNKASIFI